MSHKNTIIVCLMNKLFFYIWLELMPPVINSYGYMGACVVLYLWWQNFTKIARAHNKIYKSASNLFLISTAQHHNNNNNNHHKIDMC